MRIKAEELRPEKIKLRTEKVKARSKNVQRLLQNSSKTGMKIRAKNIELTSLI